MHTKNLQLLKLMAESTANTYVIEWDKWSDEETAKIEKTNVILLKYYEKLFNEFNIDDEKHTDEIFEDILENLISGYVVASIINRKKSIEKLISSI